MCLWQTCVNPIEDDIQAGDRAREKGLEANEVDGSLCGVREGNEAGTMKE